jgi:hypothetical protein
MVSDRPQPSERADTEAERDGRLERALRETVRRAFEAGYERLAEGPENVRQFVSDLKLPKEALGVVLGQLEETKNGVYRAVAKEVREFLERSNVAEEIAKVLTLLSFEIKTEVRFIPNDARSGVRPVPEVRSKLSVRRAPEAATDPEVKPPVSGPPRARAPLEDPPR